MINPRACNNGQLNVNNEIILDRITYITVCSPVPNLGWRGELRGNLGIKTEYDPAGAAKSAA